MCARTTVVLATLVLLAPPATPALAAKAATPAPPGAAAAEPAGSARSFTLKNGARVLLVPDPRAAAVSVGLWLDAGTRYERAGSVGISHLVEHLSARGIDPGGETEVRRRIEAMGGGSGSFTTDDFTCFLDTAPRSGLETVLGLEAMRFAARPTQAMLDQDRAGVREEIRTRARLNPLERPLQELYAAAFPNHPYRFPSGGIDEDLAKISLKDCQDYLKSRYTPDHLLVTVVGDFDPDEAQNLVRRTIEPIAGKGDPRGAPLKLPDASGKRVTLAGDMAVPILVVGWRAAPDAKDEVALELLSTVLSGGSASRLPRRVVGDQQACLFASAARDRQRDATLFWAVAALRPGADSSAVEKALIAEVERLAQEPVPGDELDRARKQVEVALLSGRESAGDRGQAIGMADMLGGDWRDADREYERLRTMTPADLQQAAARILTATGRTVVWLRASSDAAGSR